MDVVAASPELAIAAHGIIARDMSRHLVRRAVNIKDDAAVVLALGVAGFGKKSIRCLWPCAVAISSGFAVISRAVH